MPFFLLYLNNFGFCNNIRLFDHSNTSQQIFIFILYSNTFCLFTFLFILNFVGDIHFSLHKSFTILFICNHWLPSFDWLLTIYIDYVSGLILVNNYDNLVFAKITPWDKLYHLRHLKTEKFHCPSLSRSKWQIHLYSGI